MKTLKHWRTTLLGVTAIGIGLWSMHATHIPSQTFYFHVFYVWPGQLGLITAGIIGLFAADSKHS